jgi:hypothetical protein
VSFEAAYWRLAALSRSDSHADRVQAEAEAGAYNDVQDALRQSENTALQLLADLIRSASDPIEPWQIETLTFGVFEGAVIYCGYGPGLLRRLLDLEPRARPVYERYVETHPDGHQG